MCTPKIKSLATWQCTWHLSDFRLGVGAGECWGASSVRPPDDILRYIVGLCIGLTWICCLMRSMATVFSAPLGTITSAYFLVGRQNSSKAGFTRVVYWGHRLALGHRRRIT